MRVVLPRDLPRYECVQRQVERYSGVDPSACEATLVTLRVANDVLEAIQEHLAKHDLSVGRFTVLMLLNRDPAAPLKPSELAEKSGVTRATMTGLIEGLARDGLVERCGCPGDRRTCSIVLTDRAQRKLDALLPDYYERIAGLMAGLGRADRRTLVQLLGKVAEGVPRIRSRGPRRPRRAHRSARPGGPARAPRR